MSKLAATAPKMLILDEMRVIIDVWVSRRYDLQSGGISVGEGAGFSIEELRLLHQIVRAAVRF